MKISPLAIPGVVEFTPIKHGDGRGYFAETWSRQLMRSAGYDIDWIQDNQSYSKEKGVLRGLHFQVFPHAQDKLIRVLRGAIFDVAVDLRIDSPSYGKWTSCLLSSQSFNQLLIPKGFAHGFLTLEPDCEVAYKVSAPYAPSADRSLAYDDPALAIDWPLDGLAPTLSEKDRKAPRLAEIAAEISF